MQEGIIKWVVVLCCVGWCVNAGPTLEKWQQVLLDAHNRYRSSVSPPAKNMFELNWDPVVADNMDRYLSQCRYEHSDSNQWRHSVAGAETYEDLGENLAYCAGTACPSDIDQWEGTGWWDERTDYTLSSDSSRGVTAHYTQMVSSNVKFLGCARKHCPAGTGPWGWSGDWWLFGCQYGPRGQAYWVGTRPYEQGSGSTTTLEHHGGGISPGGATTPAGSPSSPAGSPSSPSSPSTSGSDEWKAYHGPSGESWQSGVYCSQGELNEHSDHWMGYLSGKDACIAKCKGKQGTFCMVGKSGACMYATHCARYAVDSSESYDIFTTLAVSPSPPAPAGVGCPVAVTVSQQSWLSGTYSQQPGLKNGKVWYKYQGYYAYYLLWVPQYSWWAIIDNLSNQGTHYLHGAQAADTPLGVPGSKWQKYNNAPQTVTMRCVGGGAAVDTASEGTTTPSGSGGVPGWAVGLGITAALVVGVVVGAVVMAVMKKKRSSHQRPATNAYEAMESEMQETPL